jgi:hypothetical protein
LIQIPINCPDYQSEDPRAGAEPINFFRITYISLSICERSLQGNILSLQFLLPNQQEGFIRLSADHLGAVWAGILLAGTAIIGINKQFVLHFQKVKRAGRRTTGSFFSPQGLT